jgi:anaerobic selenocysteine-containing dehydrogenase
VIGKAGNGTPNMDGNTRLCTATAAAALKQSFGTDGQPGSYTDVDHCDALALWGHNVAETQTVLWMRMLDRLAGPDRPRRPRSGWS